MTEIQTLTQQVLGAFFLMSFVLGVISQRTHFCTMGAVSDVVNMGDWTRARQWMAAVGVVMIGFAALSGSGQIDASKTLYAGSRFIWLSTLVGGFMFGYGMVISSGCGNKTLVRIGGGNLKSVVVFVVMGVSAFATLKGITAVVRVNTVDAVALDMPAGAHLGTLLGWLLGINPDVAAVYAGFALGAVFLGLALRHKDFWIADNLLASLGVGAIVVALWWISGHFGFVAEHPETLEPVYLATNSGRIEALTFVAPVAQALDWLMFFSDKSKVLTVGVVSVVGIIGIADQDVSLGRLCQPTRSGQPLDGQRAHGRGRRDSDGLHVRPRFEWHIYPQSQCFCGRGCYFGGCGGGLASASGAHGSQLLWLMRLCSSVALVA
jgi:uncharacterized protein